VARPGDDGVAGLDAVRAVDARVAALDGAVLADRDLLGHGDARLGIERRRRATTSSGRLGAQCR
jgi:hypothetical protein